MPPAGGNKVAIATGNARKLQVGGFNVDRRTQPAARPLRVLVVVRTDGIRRQKKRRVGLPLNTRQLPDAATTTTDPRQRAS